MRKGCAETAAGSKNRTLTLSASEGITWPLQRNNATDSILLSPRLRSGLVKLLPILNITDRLLEVHRVIDPFCAAVNCPPFLGRILGCFVQTARTPGFELVHHLIGMDVCRHDQVHMIRTHIERVQLPTANPAMVTNCR